MDIPNARSFFRKTLDLDTLKTVAAASIRKKYIQKDISKYIEQVEKHPGSGCVDVLLHDGDLVIDGDFSTGIEPWTGWLIVRGNLEVKGLLEDWDDPESSIIITGNLCANNLITRGWLEVHGDLRVHQNLIFLHNDCSAEIFGDVSAEFVYTKYHHIKIHGALTGELISGDYDRYEAGNKGKYQFVNETYAKMINLVDRRILVIEGNPDSGDEDDWSIDYLDSDKLELLIRNGEPVLTKTKSSD
jgi:hypothetical protein